MKSILLTACMAIFLSVASASSGSVYKKHTKLSPAEIDGIKVTLSTEEISRALAQISTVLISMPDKYMLVIREAVLDVAEGEYYLLYDILNDSNEVVTSVAEPMLRGEDGNLYVVSGF